MEKDDSKKPTGQESIPATKVQRAARFVKTGVKVGGNYVKHYAKKAINAETSIEELHENNATEIYGTLSELKGSALKIAQMMSMDKNLLPRQYADRFQMAQYSAPPLSYPLVVKTFQKEFGKSPSEMFDVFSKEAVNAASIGQVHQAEVQGKKLAVKVQYPGVADSVKSDLRLVKPFAVRMMGLNERDIDFYMEEVETMLLQETDYELELKRSLQISEACSIIPNIHFPGYYAEFSGKRILTMDWLEGDHLDKFLASDPSQEVRNQIGQALWDFYEYQIHTLRELHADPHPGNFLMKANGTLGIIDFGCVKVLPNDFYQQYFTLINPNVLNDREKMLAVFYELLFIYPDDSEEDKKILIETFEYLITLLGRPFYHATFDFSDTAYFEEIYQFGESSAKIKPLRYSKKPRGSKHGLYLNRTYFGLYSILHELKAHIHTSSKYLQAV